MESGARMKFWSQTNKSKPKVCMSMALAGVRKETRRLIGWGRDVLIGPSDYVFLKSDKLFLSSSHFLRWSKSGSRTIRSWKFPGSRSIRSWKPFSEICYQKTFYLRFRGMQKYRFKNYLNSRGIFVFKKDLSKRVTNYFANLTATRPHCMWKF